MIRRPFRLVAGSASIEARAGTFDAAFVGGSGSVEPASAGPPLQGGTAQSNAIAQPVGAEQSLEFDGEPLRSAIMRINQAGLGAPIELDPRLDTLRVTGVFRRQDSHAIARSLALAFGVELAPTSSGALLLTPEK